MFLFHFHTGDGLLDFNLGEFKINIGVFARKGFFGGFDFLFFGFLVNFVGEGRPLGKHVDQVV